LQLTALIYNYKAKSDDGDDLDVIQMGAYGDIYYGGDNYTGGVAAKANMYVAGLAYTVLVEWGPISKSRRFDPHFREAKKRGAGTSQPGLQQD